MYRVIDTEGKVLRVLWSKESLAAVLHELGHSESLQVIS